MELSVAITPDTREKCGEMTFIRPITRKFMKYDQSFRKVLLITDTPCMSGGNYKTQKFPSIRPIAPFIGYANDLL